jgi:hypothetical protein
MSYSEEPLIGWSPIEPRALEQFVGSLGVVAAATVAARDQIVERNLSRSEFMILIASLCLG